MSKPEKRWFALCDLYSLSSGEAVSRWKYRRQEETETRVMGDGERSPLDIFGPQGFLRP